ncbi:MAG: hypothetical protein CMG13_02095 [Candidatus Marinimicrobia bacterium]|nr:hypothetical protein [Candidatus Neomarinimicrobiota bacterium]
MKNITFCLFLIFSILQSDTYSWDNGGTILGSFGNLGSATNVDNALVLTEDPISGTPSAYVAAVSGLSGGESIEVCLDMYTPDEDVKGRIWGHYYDGVDINSYDGSASGGDEYADTYGAWETNCYTWIVEAGKVGFILEARLYSYNDGSPLTVDNLIINSSGGSIIFPGDVSIIAGCTDANACNYDSEATSNDGSCLYDDCLGECGGYAVEDCLGVCNGAAEFDSCGICDGDSSPEDCQGSSLFFSEYAEGSSNNKYLEIYNGGTSDVDLGDYSLSSCSNGCDDGINWDYPNNVTFDSGTIVSPGGVYVVCHGSADAQIQAECDQTFTYLSNGDDVFGLTQVGSGLVLDIIGLIGDDPGDGWEVCGTSNGTKDHTLVRISSVVSGNNDWVSSSSSESCEWAILDQNSWCYLSSHPHAETPACEGGGSGGEDCTNGIDDDGDGFIDCNDFDCDCGGEDCTNGIDDDGDGFIDCNDFDCDCGSGEDCTNGIDDDGDGYIDCNDFDCDGESACPSEICDDGIDNDGDGFIDCNDFDCDGESACPSEICDDGIDNDGDGFIDCDDFGCGDDTVCGGGGSCAEYGCVDYNPDNACQCNDLCADFGNCCDDYEQECSDEGCTDPNATNYNPNATIDNGTCDYSAPVANAGLDQTVDFQELVTLSGSGYSGQGDIIGYIWTQVSGPDVVLSSYENQTVTFTAPDELCTLTFGLQVIDGVANFSASDEVVISVGTPSIFDIQYTEDQGSYCYETDAAGTSVSLSGIVTHVKPGSYPNFFIQDADSESLWSGIYVYDTSVAPMVGDELIVTGTVNEYYSLTQLLDISSYQVVSQNNIVAPLSINAADLGIECSFSGEQYESMLVEIEDVSFDSVDEFGNWAVSDGSGGMTMVDDYFFDGSFPSISVGDTFDCVSGVVSYSYSEFKIYPRNIDDFSCYGATACDSANGDANADGFTDILDLVGIISTIVNQTDFTDYELCVSDVNGDGEVNVLDIVVIVNLIIS